MIAYCGLDCEECPAYLAKRNDDQQLRARAAESWSSPEFLVLPEEVNCDGCKIGGGQIFKHCAGCEVRSCCGVRGFETCAECPEYGCRKLEDLFAFLGFEPRRRLEEIRAGLV